MHTPHTIIVTQTSSFFTQSSPNLETQQSTTSTKHKRTHVHKHPRHLPNVHRSEPNLFHVVVNSDSSDDDDMHNKTHHSIVDGDYLGHDRRSSRANSIDDDPAVSRNQSLRQVLGFDDVHLKADYRKL